MDSLLKEFLISYAPTVLFISIIMLAGIVGVFRGFRKNLILLVQSVICFLICLVLYFIIINIKAADKFILDFINLFMGPDGLESFLGVDQSCETLKEVLICYIPIGFNYGDSISLLIKDNGAYLLTLVDLTYHIVFAIILYFVYFILVFISYIIFQIFYPERRFKKKVTKNFAFAKTDRSYNKHPYYGGLLGLFRGLLSALMLFSLFGSLFYVVSGGNTEKIEDVSFGDEQIDTYYNLYQEIDSYGSKGIFKVLNSVKDKKDTPYYLYAADIIFRGEINDENLGFNEEIIFREELTNYTKFTKRTYNLLMKYGKDEILSIINSNNPDSIMDKVVEVMSNKDFQNEFKGIIIDFETNTYFVNLTLSLINSILKNIDTVDFFPDMDNNIKEILQILFKPNYLSKNISYERQLQNEKEALKDSVIYDEKRYNLPYINASSLIEKNDVIKLFEALTVFIKPDMNYKIEDYFTLTKEALPYIQGLSIFKESNINPVLGRLFTYYDEAFKNTYFSIMDLEYNSDEIDNYLSFINQDVMWTKEIISLLDSTKYIYEIYMNVFNLDEYNQSKDQTTYILNAVFKIFDDKDENYSKNKQNFDLLIRNVTESKLLGKALSTNYFYLSLTNNLKINMPNIYLERDINYNNQIDQFGNVTNGEFYNLLQGIKLLCTKDNYDFVLNLIKNENVDITNTLKELSRALSERDELGKTISDYVLESKILKSLISNYLIENSNISEDIKIYVTNECKEQDDKGNLVNLINKDILKDLLLNLGELINIISPLIDNSDKDLIEELNKIITNDNLSKMFDNLIIEGTVSYFVKNYLVKEKEIIMPKSLDDINNWVTKNKAPGELKYLFNGIKSSKIDLSSLTNADTSKIIDQLSNLDERQVKDLFESNIIYYTTSNKIETFKNDVEIIVPNSSKITLTDDSISSIINKDELVYLFEKINIINKKSDTEINDFIKEIVKNKEIVVSSKIILATFANYIVNNKEFTENAGNSLIIPIDLKIQGSKENLLNLESHNPWNNECLALLNSIDEIFNISSGADFELTEKYIENIINDQIKFLNQQSNIISNSTKLDVCMSSKIMLNSFTKQIDDAFKDVVSVNAINSAKQNGLYKASEIKALVDVINLYDLDIKNIDEKYLTERIKNEILTYNNINPEFNNRTYLNVLYSSNIIKSLFTQEIEKQINTLLNINDLIICRDIYNYFTEAEVKALIDSLNVLNISFNEEINIDNKLFSLSDNDVDILYKSYILIYIINDQLDNNLSSNNSINNKILQNDLLKCSKYEYYTKYYRDTELKSIIHALNELNINNINDFDLINFDSLINTLNNPSTINQDISRLDLLYESYILQGIISKSILDEVNKSENKNLLNDHPFAYNEEIETYRKIEIKSLVEILNTQNINSINDFDIEKMTIRDLKPYILVDNITKSYLIVATISINICSDQTLVVPIETLDKRITTLAIKPKDLIELIDACEVMNIGVTEIDINSDEIRSPKTNEQIDAVIKSKIMSANITKNMVFKYIKGQDDAISCYASEIDVIKTKDTDGKTILILTESELKKLFEGINIYNDEGNDEQVSFNVLIDLNKIKGKSNDEISKIFDSNTLRIGFSDILIRTINNSNNQILQNTLSKIIIETECYDMSIPSRTFFHDTLAKDALINILSLIN